MNLSARFGTMLRLRGRAFLLAIMLVLLTPATLAAKSLPSTHPWEPIDDTEMSGSVAGAEQGERSKLDHDSKLAIHPPLPFKTPQVGPVIKRTYADDIDRRTTAFVPQTGALDNLTPVEMPTDEARWIRVDLSEQLVVAYEADRPVRAFVISSGLPRTPTVTGTFRIRTKVRQQVMSGENYYLPGVQWVQYFYADYSFHGTYWHNNFGNPMSHGCLNMTNADAKWLFDWAGPIWDHKTIWFKSTADNPGTLVVITE
jgi:lipoprotein-anchoring transpeptidase ErfK/SrfK